MSKLKKFFEDFDMFGYAINFNFNGSGNRHNTLLGGIISLTINVLATVFFCTNLDRMVNHKFNTQYTETGFLDINHVGVDGEVDYLNTGLKYFWNIYRV